MTTRTASALALVLLLAPSAGAQSIQSQQPPPTASNAPPADPQYPVIRVGMLSYRPYDLEAENRDGLNSFDVTRAYLNINAQVAKNVRFRFTPDIRRINDGSLAGSLVARVKYAFAQIDNVTPQGWIRLGAHQTPWLDFEESIDRYRVQGTMFAEREGLIPGSSDFGVSYFTPLPGGFGEVQGGVFNGEGYAQAEANKYKSAQVRVTVRPFPKTAVAKGLRVSGFYNAGWYAAERPRRLAIVMGSFEHTHLVTTWQVLKATERPTPADVRDVDRSGWSVFAEPRQGPSGLAGLIRYDAFDQDDAVGANELGRLIAGGAYWFVWPRARVGVVLTNEQVRYDLATRGDENRWLLQMHIDF
jgi:hypothetical protein